MESTLPRYCQCQNDLLHYLQMLFHTMQAMDYLAIGVHELASMSERRQERLMNPGMCVASLHTD